MKIKKFSGKKINGHLDLSIDFYDSLSFVTGINGTGKTTALNSIVSLLLPKIDYLSLQNYEKISITIEHNDLDCTIEAIRTEAGATIRCDLFPESAWNILSFDYDENLPPPRTREAEQNFYKEQMVRGSDNPILSYIEMLPTPMYLGLDRRILTLDESLHRYRNSHYYRPRRRNVFSQSLSQSLNEAVGFASERFRLAQREKLNLDEKLRRELVLDLIELTPVKFNSSLEMPTDADFEKALSAKRNLKRLPDLLGLPADSVSKKIDPFFEFLEKTLSSIRKETLKKKPSDEVLIASLMEWSYNQSHLSRLNAISERISNYNKRVERLFKELKNFLDGVEKFFKDSGKKIDFDSFGELIFTVKGENEERDLRALSSGEIQLIVILTHLHFNPEVRKASVFIIDEPELSLHVEWQEKFVDAMIEANAQTQFIMATHSPSIILDKTKLCIDLTPRKSSFAAKK